jgi:AraC family transcriptional regulator, regulatory protein of adaptative response / methylated-DNA-[protein]-cysteine methyltransferase
VLDSAIVRHGLAVRARRKSVTAVANGAASGDGDGLGWKRCDRARLARDPRFDGRFFTGVLTTRIYCRPTCPVKPAQSRNVVFFATAAAAERAGFRPCLRCRPETAPGTPAWRGAAATVSRALRLIERGFLDDGKTVEDLAGTLGMTTRHLRRLFDRYAGAPPTAVATTRRVQRAKRLIDETTMPMSEIAFAAGFASIRRFNAAFRAAYRRPPTAVRRSLRHRPLVGQVASQRA